MSPVSLPQKLTGRTEVDVVAVNPQEAGGDVEDGVEVVQVQVGASGSVANHQIDQVHTEDDNLQAEQHDRAPLYL